MSFCHPDFRRRFSPKSTTPVALFGENCVISQHGAIEPGQYFVRRRAAPSPILGIATGPPLNVNNMSGFLGKKEKRSKNALYIILFIAQKYFVL